MPGAHDFVIRDTTFYVAQNVCIVTTTLLTFEMLIRLFVKIEVHEHASRDQDDLPFVPQRPNSSPLFTGCENVLKRMMDHFAPQDQGDRYRKSFLLYGMGGVGKTQICLKFVEMMAGR